MNDFYSVNTNKLKYIYKINCNFGVILMNFENDSFNCIQLIVRIVSSVKKDNKTSNGDYTNWWTIGEDFKFVSVSVIDAD